VSGQAEWTILVFLNAKNNLEPFAFSNFQQMARIGSTREVTLLVEMGRPKHHYSHQFGSWSTTLRFVIEKGTEPTEAQAVSDLGAKNMGDAQTLIDFVRWGRETYPAKRTMLVIWNHGQGWRAPIEEGVAPLEPAIPHGGHRYVSNDDDTGDKLYNRAIQDALGNLLADERIDLIAFDACLMAMVETAYALRGVARVMVGSEELEPGNGWNYARWLQPLIAANGNIESAELARMLVRGMKDEYGDTDATTLSATDLDKVLPLASAISAFSDAAVPHLNSKLSAFRAARAACKNYAPGYGLNSIDLGHYMEQIETGAFPALLKQRAADVRARLKEVIIENYASMKRQGSFGSTGLGIYYPSSAAAHGKDSDREGYEAENDVFPVEFVKKEQWAGFLHEYWKLVP
jgi:cysteine peptidase C11 family protein